MANIEKLISCLKHCAGNGDCLQCDRWTLNIEYKCVDDLLLSAAIALEEKQATSNNGKQWIPVTERLPDICESVLACYDFMGGKAVRVSDRYGKIGLLWSGIPVGVKVTHWMPLPEPPTEE